MEEYSENEIKLFTSFGFKNINLFNPIPLYNMAMNKVFSEGITGANVEALRRAIDAINGCKVWRMTDEWDKLISFVDMNLEEVKFGQKFKLLGGEIARWIGNEKDDIFQKTQCMAASFCICITSQTSFKTRIIGNEILKNQYVYVVSD